MKLILGFITLVTPLLAQAGWILDSERVNIDTMDRYEIANSFAWVPYARDVLVADELAAPSKIIVTKAQVKVGVYHWENEPNCAVLDPQNYTNVTMPQFAYDFYYKDDTTSKLRVEGGTAPVVKCDGSQRTVGGNKYSFKKI